MPEPTKDKHATSPTSVYVNPTDNHEDMLRTDGDKACWSTFVYTMLLALSFCALLLYNQWSLQWSDTIRMHTFEYFIVCMIGGALSGAVPHTLLTPMDLIKCRVQVGEYANSAEGFHSIHVVEARRSWLASIPLLYRGWAPTVTGYAIQGSLKFGLYEVFKYTFDGRIFSHEFAAAHRVTVYLFASSAAEFLADIPLAPWEAVKVKMQTTRTYPPKLNIVVPKMWAAEQMNAFFKGLVPLWMRQIPYTMVKFTSFEKIAEFFFLVFVSTPKESTPKHVQIAVSLVAGFCAGVLCAIVSHPADTVVSKLNQRTEKSGSSLWTFVGQLGCRDLWKGLVVRLVYIGTLTAIQWVIYDSFKVSVGLPTTGGAKATAAPVMAILTRKGEGILE